MTDKKTPFGRVVTQQDLDEAQGITTRTPWGRPLQEAGAAMTMAGGAVAPKPPLVKPTVEDFRAVGLNAIDAAGAAAGLSEGKFLSFEDACLSTVIFKPSSKSRTLDESAMRDRARRFMAPAGD
ncbi:hypothetical protein NPS01_37780 [Nocardioides psychrotolerans]|uniref:Uncharacterized protein n=1 Tax=Nocardioides psychrotolerans TaxID=1005945 RepID=A0A1I3I6Z0_9ACTN|nr:hypothetical protein [Nocardioides psychrotolerans]GEP40115.1 hypothetical protein NPS01_37780 [Nocardioides psychrotolerans]SFI43682.1 hypothetical protein SAMN05216561_108142 [Nocardioides psychrotolerans]